MKKGSKFPPSELNGLKTLKKSEKSVTLIFQYFCGKGFRHFFCSQYILPMTDIISGKNAKNFYCEKCSFTCSKKANYEQHLLTRKHQNTSKLLTNTYTESAENAPTQFVCECGINYKHRQSLYNHKKKCTWGQTSSNNSGTEPQQPTNELVMSLLNQNMELQKQIIELCKEKNTVINNNNSNNTNNQFNLNFFLNEQCKDALNLMDFVNQIKLQLSDLDMIGRVGYAEGMSKIFIKNLQEMDVFKRPIHCSDLKREVLYVKDKDTWEKENGENVKIKRAIKAVEHKNIKQIPQWVEENPSAADTETKKHMEYQKILLEAMGGSTMEDDDKKREKIIRNIAKEVTINKTVER
jgi:hypothetical protein